MGRCVFVLVHVSVWDMCMHARDSSLTTKKLQDRTKRSHSQRSGDVTFALC